MKRVRRDDAGQVATAVVVCALLGAVALLVGVLLPLAGASDQRSRAQTAADAAALAYLDGLAKGIEKRLESPLGYGGGQLHALVGCGVGRGRAEEYALRNGARLDGSVNLAGCGRRDRTRVVVDVEMIDALPSGQRSRARAAAQMGFPTGDCDLSPDPTKVYADFLEKQAAAKAAADAAKEAAQEAAADAAQAVKDAANAPPDSAEELQKAAEKAQDDAEKAADKAAKTSDKVPADPVPITADCGPVSLQLVLELPTPELRFVKLSGGTLKKLLQPRLVSTRDLEL